MKILHLTVSLDRGGSENHLISLIEGQCKINHKIIVVYLKGRPFWEDYLIKLGVTVIKLKGVYNFFHLAQLLRTLSPDVLHAHLQTSEILSVLALTFRKRIKFIISKHNDEDSWFIPKYLQAPFYRLLSRRSNAVIAISENVRKYCINRLRIDSSKIIVVYYGVDSDKYDSEYLNPLVINNLCDEFLIEKDEVIIGTISRLHPQKSLDTLIAAMDLVVNKYNNFNIKCLIVGEGRLENQLKAQVESLNLESHVKFVGKRNDIKEILHIMDIFILCSIYEGLGLVLLEAMCARVPIIGTDAGAIPEIVGENGIIIEKKNAIALADAIVELSKDKIRRDTMGELGFDYVSSKFTIDNMVINTEKTYNL
jgi:glycosyltransferase involved in cell wall biosynthesis